MGKRGYHSAEPVDRKAEKKKLDLASKMSLVALQCLWRWGSLWKAEGEGGGGLEEPSLEKPGGLGVGEKLKLSLEKRNRPKEALPA